MNRGQQVIPSVSHEEYQEVLQHLPNPVCIVDEVDGILYANPSALEYTGYREDQLIGMHLGDLFPDETEKGSHGSSNAWSGRTTLRTADGGRKITSNSVGLIREGAGAPQLFVLSFQNAEQHHDDGVAREQRKVLLDERMALRTLIENLPDAIYAKDAQGRKTIVNRADLQNMGLTREDEALGKTDFDLFSHDLAAGFWADDLQILQTGTPVINREEFVVSKNGGKRWLQTSKLPLRDETGTVVGLVGIGHDITRRKIADEILRESQRRLSDIIQFFPQATLVIDQAGRVIAWNQAMERLTGVEASAMVGKGNFEYALPFYGIRCPLLVDHLRDASLPLEGSLSRIEREGDSISARASIVRGKRLFLHATATLLRDNNGEVTGAIESLLDITAQEEAEERIRASEARFRLISENVADLIIVLEHDGTCTYASPSWRQEQLEPEALVGQSLLKFVHPDDVDTVRSGIEQLVSTCVPQPLEFRLLGSEAACRHKEATMSLLVTDESIRIVAVMHDVSERIASQTELLHLHGQISQRNADLEKSLSDMKQMQEGLVQSEKLASIGQLTAGIAHEINNPLAFVSSNLNRFAEYFDDVTDLVRRCDVVLGEIAHDDKYAAIAKELKEAEDKIDVDFLVEDFAQLMKHTKDGTERIRSIVDRLRGFTHLAGNDFFESDINVAIEDTIALTWNELKYKATVQKEYGEIPRVACNIGEIKQVLVNLLVNAAHAIPEKGCITVRTGRSDDHVIIQVEDTGGGIAPSNLNKIFDPFFTTKAVGKGTGLGLWISATLIQKHKGKLHAQSQEGKGTIMTIELPIEQTEMPR